MNGPYTLPPILSGTTEQQVSQLRDYLVRIVRQLPTEGEIDQAIVRSGTASGNTGYGGGSETAASDRARADELRALIIKTANDVKKTADRIETTLTESYVAKSDYGDYYEQIESKVEQTARGTIEGYNFSELIEAAAAIGRETFLSQINGQIRRGLIVDPSTQQNVIGIVVSQNLRFLKKQDGTDDYEEYDGVKYYKVDQNEAKTVGIYTSAGWQFWAGTTRIGWFSSEDKLLHVPSMVVETKIKIGTEWEISAPPSEGFGIRYVGS